MASQIKFFNKNRLDLSIDTVALTVTDAVATNTGQAFVDFVRNRNNSSAWLTTGSTDAANTKIEAELNDDLTLTDIILISHNFKSYTLKYWDGFSFVDFSPVISVSANAETTTNHEFTEVNTSKLQLIITSTIIVDADKQLKQWIATTKLATGQLVGWPVIKTPRHNTNKKVNKMLSGKVNVVESVGGFSMTLTVSNWNIDADLSLIEDIYFGRRAILVWLSGGDDAQFSHKRIGYRKEDIFFMRAINDYSPEWRNGIYVNGIKMNLKMSEAIG